MSNAIVSGMLPDYCVSLTRASEELPNIRRKQTNKQTWLNVVVSHPIWVQTKGENSNVFTVKAMSRHLTRFIKKIQRREKERLDLLAEQQHVMKYSVDLYLHYDRGNFFSTVVYRELSTDSCFFLRYSIENVLSSIEFAAWHMLRCNIWQDFSYLLFPFIVP